LSGEARERVANRVAAIRKNAVFGEAPRVRCPLTMKIFSLPKFATQSPRHALLEPARDLLALAERLITIIFESQKHLKHRLFLQT
jgi:hypothetical protein